MRNNSKQKILTQVERRSRVELYPSFSEALEHIIGRDTASSLATDMMVDPGALSRFRHGEGNLGIAAIDRFLTKTGMALAPRHMIENAEERHAQEMLLLTNAYETDIAQLKKTFLNRFLVQNDSWREIVDSLQGK